ncbi:MAG: ComEC/Rec2 family competence protein [Ruminococcus sp.]|uniref:ComEC/Rec2 family competence protein n=1 Tax=Ruminococcus sp. TaxID=41978 RepID=UPI0025F13144|nr:ComEC/Rec2 family competence protein [Ruminococcus sp.]MBR5683668.1 ComEC/Rec2 family competence protein [Ruminococcus sp.]
MKRKMIGAAAAYMAGLFFASFFTDPVLMIIAGAVIATALLAGRKYDFRAVDHCIMAVFFGAAVLAFNAYTAMRYAPAVEMDGQDGSFRGEVLSVQHYSGDNTSYVLKGSINGIKKAKLSFFANSLEAETGDTIDIGSCTFEKLSKDYLFDSEKYYRSDGIFLEITKASDINILRPSKRSIKAAVNDYREKIIYDFHVALGRDSGDLLAGMVFGEKRGMDHNVKTAVYRCGIGHILAVSGLHVSIAVFILMSLLRLLRVNKYLSFAVMELLLLFLVTMANYPVSAVRAAIMMNFLYAAGLFRRQNDTFNSLAGAVLMICICQPYVVYDEGFILSVAGTFGIGVFAPYMTKNMPDDTALQSFTKKTAVMLCTMLCVFPFSLLYFDETSLISPITNMLVVPLCSVSMTIGLLYALTGGIFDLLFIPKVINEFILRFSDSISRIRFTYFSGSNRAVIYGLLICMIITVLTAAMFRNRKFICGAAAFSAAFLFIASAAVKLGRNSHTVIAVLGKGSNAVVVVSRDNSADIIDISGHYRSADYVRKYLTVNGISHVDYAVLTQKVQSGYVSYGKELEFTDISNWIISGETEIPLKSDNITYYSNDITILENGYDINITDTGITISTDSRKVRFISDSKEHAAASELTVLCGKAAKGEDKAENILDLSENNNFEIVLSDSDSFTIRRL